MALENVQRRATKQIPGFKNMSYEDRLQKLKLPTLAYRRKRGDMIETYKITSGTYDATLPPLFQQHPDVTMKTRGHSKKLYLRRANTNIRQNFFTYRVISIWNSLPENVISVRNVKIFESRLDKYWIYRDIIYDFKSNLTTAIRAGTEYSGMWPALRRGSVRICKNHL